jgi:hypothetical protein
MATSESTAPESERPAHLWKPGQSGNPGGRPKKLVAIERMLDEDFRNVDKMREHFKRLEKLAFDDQTRTVMGKYGPCDITEPPNPAFTKLYLERVLGPVKEIEPDLSDAPDEVIDYLRGKLS